MTPQTPATAAPVTVREVGLRDGLQILPRTLPTEHKLQWLRARLRRRRCARSRSARSCRPS